MHAEECGAARLVEGRGLDDGGAEAEIEKEVKEQRDTGGHRVDAVIGG